MSADLKSVREMVNAVKKEFGAIDGLVNNAGITRDKVLVMISEDDWAEVIRTNLTGSFNFVRARIASKANNQNSAQPKRR